MGVVLISLGHRDGTVGAQIQLLTPTHLQRAGSAVAGAPAGPTTQNSTAFAYRPFKQPGVIGNWPNWDPYCRPQNSIDKIDLNAVSVVSYAFPVNILANGTFASFESWADSTWVPTTLKGVAVRTGAAARVPEAWRRASFCLDHGAGVFLASGR
ncbi:hypothetical protein DFJ73DRAFT_917618 [Zopfochytrium polystomum]|nr:hypothetical protein DFJ73DRAFT_917618 [Zopfochytrium polystomum]